MLLCSPLRRGVLLGDEYARFRFRSAKEEEEGTHTLNQS